MTAASSIPVEMLTAIWQRILQRSSIGPDDNFFDLGGDPDLAAKLVGEIAQVQGREIPALVIYTAPTVARLSDVLENPSPPRLPPLLPLKKGTGEPPAFFAHGVGGNVMEFFELLRHVDYPHPIYGLQARGTDGIDNPLDRIEDMAQSFLGAIRELQPQGPYVLVGYSLGGLVMLEIARRLSETGEEIALLAMLDAYPHIRRLPLRQRARLTLQLARRPSAVAADLPIREVLPYVVGAIERRLLVTRGENRRTADRSSIDSLSRRALERVRDSAKVALQRYRPRLYNGAIKFVRAETVSVFPDDPVAVWAHLAAAFEVQTVPGDHLSMLTTHCESLAVVVSRYLREAI